MVLQNTKDDRWAAEKHYHDFHKLLDDFFTLNKASDFIDGNNELINSFLLHALNENNENHNPDFIKDVIFNTGQINKFITSLQEQWQNYHKYCLKLN